MMLIGQYEASLVIVSMLVAIFASYTALSLAGRIAKSHSNAVRWWIAGGALAMGIGIWSMHFIGMLAFRLPIPIGYDWSITFFSLALPVVVSALALWQVGQPQLPFKRLLSGAILMGIGINGMHYTGMAAMRMEPGILYDPILFAASVIIAIGASGAALWVAFKLREDVPRVWLPRMGAAILMGLAIVGMHYTGMAAAHFPLGSICLAASQGFSQDGLAVMVIIATFGVLTIAMMASIFDARLESRSEVLAISQGIAEERQILLHRERAARTQAEHMSSLKDEFLATLSHELRTPLNSILGWAHILRKGVKDEATLQKGLDTIERNARAQAQLIDDLLDMNRIISGKVRLEMREIDPVSFIRAAIETTRPAAIAKRIEIEEIFDRDMGVMHGDPDRLQQVVWNLLSNSVKFTPSGGKIQVKMEKAKGGIVISVIDTGTGITPEFLSHVFDRFRQADASMTRRHGGLGLGLSIVKSLVELHGGNVDVISPGACKGATFTLTLPSLERGASQANGSNSHVPAFDSVLKDFKPVDLVGLKVLVVDDQPDALDLIAQILKECGAKVIIASNAYQALELAKQEKPNIIVSDIGMPDVDGFEFIRQVRKFGDVEIANIPAIALSAFTRAEDQKRALQTGFTCYLAKPVEASDLLSSIKSAVGKSRKF